MLGKLRLVLVAHGRLEQVAETKNQTVASVPTLEPSLPRQGLGGSPRFGSVWATPAETTPQGSWPRGLTPRASQRHSPGQARGADSGRPVQRSPHSLPLKLPRSCPGAPAQVGAPDVTGSEEGGRSPPRNHGAYSLPKVPHRKAADNDHSSVQGGAGPVTAVAAPLTEKGVSLVTFCSRPPPVQAAGPRLSTAFATRSANGGAGHTRHPSVWGRKLLGTQPRCPLPLALRPLPCCSHTASSGAAWGPTAAAKQTERTPPDSARPPPAPASQAPHPWSWAPGARPAASAGWPVAMEPPPDIEDTG